MRRTLLVISLLVISPTCLAQETVKVVVEEVRIPVTAKDSTGRFDPTVASLGAKVRAPEICPSQSS